jgi:hypothetical protein
VTRTITAGDLDFSDDATTLVCSGSLRFILPVPKLAGGGEPLAPPAGARAAESFKDTHGRPIKGRGIVFFNPDDDCWQAARGDGMAVIIISPVTEAEAAALMAKVNDLSGDPDRLTLDQLKAVVSYAIDELKIRSAYNSSRAFVAEHMTPADGVAADGIGLHWRQARDRCQAVFVPGRGRFMGPAATPQTFERGAVILKEGDDIRLLQPDGFEASYRFLDGRPARIRELKPQNPRGG